LAQATADLKALQDEKNREAAEKAEAEGKPTAKVLRAGVVPIADRHKKL
jgi:hypothetical protein